jgi:hypothetical protein
MVQLLWLGQYMGQRRRVLIMNNHTNGIIGLLAALTLLVACDPPHELTSDTPEGPLVSDDDDSSPTVALTPDGMPVGFTPTSEDGTLFSVNTEQDVFVSPVLGSSATLEGVLAFPDGRRSIRWVEPDGTAEVVAPGGWLLPPIGRQLSSGSSLICWGELRGEPSALTRGAMPDPRDGLALVCRERSPEGTWGAPTRLAEDVIAAWLKSIEPDGGGGFLITYYVDSGLFALPTAPEHGTWSQTWTGGTTSSPVLVHAVNPDLFAD